MDKTLNLIPSTEKHRGEEEEEVERERGRRGRERASRLRHSALGLEGLDFRRASTTAARVTAPTLPLACLHLLQRRPAVHVWLC